MVDIQSATAEIRQGKKDRKNKRQEENIMVCPIPQGDHKKQTTQEKIVYTKPEKNILNLNKCTKTKPKPKPTLSCKNCSYVCVSLCTTVVHNTAQNSSDNLPS